MTAVAADGERAGRDGLAGPQDPGGPADPVLAAEREHLARSRECLRLMREDVLSLPALAGDPVSREYLKAGLHRRAESLRDRPGGRWWSTGGHPFPGRSTGPASPIRWA